MAPEFKPLKEVGEIAASATSELRFYIDEFRGRRYASIRRFLKSPRYTGPTRSGVTMDAELLDSVLKSLEAHASDAGKVEERELGRFPRRPGVELVVRIQVYKDKPGIDIREWLDTDQYTGWSKKGVRVPYEKLKDLVQNLRGLHTELQA